jgi:hypothetical protein
LRSRAKSSSSRPSALSRLFHTAKRRVGARGLQERAKVVSGRAQLARRTVGVSIWGVAGFRVHLTICTFFIDGGEGAEEFRARPPVHQWIAPIPMRYLWDLCVHCGQAQIQRSPQDRRQEATPHPYPLPAPSSRGEGEDLAGGARRVVHPIDCSVDLQKSAFATPCCPLPTAEPPAERSSPAEAAAASGSAG